MKFIFPIAGKGSRFLELAEKIPEYKKPKALIDVKGAPMIKRAVDAFSISEKDTLIFIVRKEHVLDFGIDKKLKEVFGENIKIIMQETLPEGTAKTVLLAKDLINNKEEILITDSDFILEGEKYTEKIRKLNPDFAVPIFYSENPRSSFARVDENDKIIETAEKKTISKNAMIGSYYFKEGRFFVETAEKMIKENLKVNNEFYISPIFNHLIKEGKRGFIIKDCKLIEMGTPELLEKNIDRINNKKEIVSEGMIKLVKEAAKEAGDLTLKNFGKINLKIKTISEDSYAGFDKITKEFVSETDLGAQKIILNKLCKNYGFCSVVAEENTKDLITRFSLDSDYIWVIDPIDGTSNYLSGNEEIRKLLEKKYFKEYNEKMPDNSNKFGISVSLTKKGAPLLCVIYFPKFEEFLVSIKGKGTYLNDKKIEISKIKKHDFSDPIRISQYSKINKFKELFPNRKFFHCSTYNLKALLQKEIECYITEEVDFLDICPSLLAYVEAGGFIGDENSDPVKIEDLVKKSENLKDFRIKKFMIFCPTQSYCKSLLENLQEKGF